MSRKKVERNISYDDIRKKYYVNLDFGIDPETGKQVKKMQTFDKLTAARSALRKHEAAREAGQVVLPKDITVGQWLTAWMNDVVKLNRATTTAYSYQQMILLGQRRRHHICSEPLFPSASLCFLSAQIDAGWPCTA